MEYRFLVLVLCIAGAQSAKLKSKSSKSGADTSEPSQKSAIIAIQIIDPDEGTSGKHSKRTVDSSVGYGYQNSIFGGKVRPPKYEVYKYSQHDIPPYSGSELFKNNYGGYNGKSSYQSHGQNAGLQHFQPGTTLFSAINQHGQVGGLSSHVPNYVGGQSNVAVPIIILRVMPSQLASPATHLYPNLPQSNYFAPIVNTVDIKSLLSSYLSNANVNPVHSAPQYQPEVPSYQSYHQSQPQTYQEQSPQAEAEHVSIVKSHQTYQIDETQYPSLHGPQYLPIPKKKKPVHQYLPVSAKQSQELLIDENYPAKTHTQVIFKTEDGSIKTANNQDHSQQESYAQEPEQQYVQPNQGYSQSYSQDTTQDHSQGYAQEQAQVYQQQQQQHQQQQQQQQEYTDDASQHYVQQNYVPEPAQDLDYQQYGDQNSAYDDGNADYSEQQSDSKKYIYIMPQEHRQALPSSHKIIYVPAEVVEKSKDKKEES